MNRKINYILLLSLTLMFSACEKFVDIEPKGQLIPSTLADFRMILDQVQKMNFTGSVSELAAGDLYHNDLDFQSITNAFEKNAYTWSKDIYLPNDQATDWNVPYSRIYNANVILEGLEDISGGSETEKNTIKGEALFQRGMALYEVATLYAPLYEAATAATLKGVPIRTASNVFAISKRPTLQETYDQVLKDVELAATLLPAQAKFKSRSSKAAAYGLLARIYVGMSRYDKALENALKQLDIQDGLMDYNDLDRFAYPRFPTMNEEVLMHLTIPNFAYSFDYKFPVTEAFYNLYDAKDLRKTFFFDVEDPGTGVLTVTFGGNYGGAWSRFTGLATDETYLIAAECYARNGDYTKSLFYLNSLLEKRYVKGTYTPLVSTDETEILKKIILERRKELVARNIRWTDLKRFNRDARFAQTLQRTVAGQTLELPPNDPRYVFPIPQTVIAATGMDQNPR